MGINRVEETTIKNYIERVKVMKKGNRVSPHKYLMLLSIANILEENIDHLNRFTFNELEPVFLMYFNKFCKGYPDYTKMLEHPFYHLQADGLWFLKVLPGQDKRYQKYKSMGQRLTKKRLLETIDYGYLDETFFNLIKNKEIRKYLSSEIGRKITGRSEERNVDYPEEVVGNNHLFFKEEKSLFAHEQSAIDIIEAATLNNKYGHTVSNLLLHDRQTNNYLEYDVVLVTYWGIYVVELKHWSGHIKIAPYNWVINNVSYRSDPHKINNYKSKVLKGIYQHEFRNYPNLYVQSVVVLTNPEATVEGNTSPNSAIEEKNCNPTFGSMEDFVSYIKKSSKASNKILSEQQVSNIASYFRGLNQPKQNIKITIPGYETLEYISQKPDCVELIARPTESGVNRLNRFRIFRPPLNIPEEEKERFKKRAYNTVSAVSTIGDHPNILKVWVFKNSDGDIVEGSEWSEAGTLRDLLNNPNKVPTLEVAFDICKGIISALQNAHEAGIIHRNLCPENILMFNEIPKLSNFDLAYQIEDNRMTVIADADSLKDDGYIAPEMLTGRDIDEGTDYFNFGVILYELITGHKPFANTRSFIAQGGVLGREALRRLENSGAPESVIDLLKQLIVADRRKRLKDPSCILSVLGYEEDESSYRIGNYDLEPNERYDLYEIVKKIGEGGEAQIYKAKTIKVDAIDDEGLENTVVLKLFNKEVSREKILQEFRITNAIDSAYTVRCEKLGYWKNDRYFMELEYLEGNTLQYYIDNNQKPDLNTFLKVAHGLMDAVKALHHYKIDEETVKPYLHSDIKPDNVILLTDGKPVLIDFGIAGEPRIDVFQGTSKYIPPDSILGVDMKFSQDGDLFALGVTLWEWLFGSKPYESVAKGALTEIPQITPFQLKEYLAKWLLKAVAIDANERFQTIDEMETALKPPQDEVKEPSEPTIRVEEGRVDATTIAENDAIAIDASEEVNDFINYLNTLSNASAGNENAIAESQMRSSYYRRITVKSSLADYIYEKLILEKQNIILTGNAGDGKTTIATQIRQQVRNDSSILPPIEELAEEKLIIVKDMSELHPDERREILMQSIEDREYSYLIVSNTGTLLDSINELSSNGIPMDQSALLKVLSSDKPRKILGGKYEVINIGSINNIATACEVFERMLSGENWLKCAGCRLNTDCPIYFNVSFLKSKQEIVMERISLIYRRLYEYNVRLTMRQMLGHLAYAITGGALCSDIELMSKIELHNSASRFLFSNLFFGDDGSAQSSIAMQHLPVRQIQKAQFGAFLDPFYERKAWTHNNSNILKDEEIVTNFVEKLQFLFKQPDSNSRRQVRRMLYFFGKLQSERGKKFISVFLRSPMLLKYIQLTSDGVRLSSLEEKRHRMKILQVLQEFITGIRLPEGKWERKADYLYITLNRPGFGLGTQIVLSDFSLSDFRLEIKTKYQIAEEKNNILTLCYKNNVPRLELELPFLDYVANRYEGEIAEDLSAYYSERLNKFKIELLGCEDKGFDKDNLKLLTYGTDRAAKVVNITFVDDKLEVLL